MQTHIKRCALVYDSSAPYLHLKGNGIFSNVCPTAVSESFVRLNIHSFRAICLHLKHPSKAGVGKYLKVCDYGISGTCATLSACLNIVSEVIRVLQWKKSIGNTIGISYLCKLLVCFAYSLFWGSAWYLWTSTCLGYYVTGFILLECIRICLLGGIFYYYIIIYVITWEKSKSRIVKLALDLSQKSSYLFLSTTICLRILEWNYTVTKPVYCASMLYSWLSGLIPFKKYRIY